MDGAPIKQNGITKNLYFPVVVMNAVLGMDSFNELGLLRSSVEIYEACPSLSKRSSIFSIGGMVCLVDGVCFSKSSSSACR